jgi:pimeloyl-ACP methyl ester carboxylesterase
LRNGDRRAVGDVPVNPMPVSTAARSSLKPGRSVGADIDTPAPNFRSLHRVTILPCKMGPMLSHISTTDTVRDMDALREPIGEDHHHLRWPLVRTMIGQIYANTFPERVRVMMLDGIVDPVAYTTDAETRSANNSESTDKVFDQFLTTCEAASAFYAGYDESDREHVLLGAAGRRLAEGKTLVSTTFVVPYPPGFPVLVPGQVISKEILYFLAQLDVKEIHGYNPALGLSVFTETAIARLTAARHAATAADAAMKPSASSASPRSDRNNSSGKVQVAGGPNRRKPVASGQRAVVARRLPDPGRARPAANPRRLP